MNKKEKKSYAVFGLGEFGRSVALELMNAGADVMVLDVDEDRVSDMADDVTLAMQIDATEERSYEEKLVSDPLSGTECSAADCPAY
ncbi:MAG: hypothetical protein EGQ63_06260, partial [Clostridiales bacterium]|nr:hypothetical protein [Clostridiales bacterium]